MVEGARLECVTTRDYGCPGATAYQWQCSPENPPPPEWKTGRIVPHFIITHVVYSVPGKSSSMAYSQGETVGSTLTLEKSSKNEVKVEAGSKGLMTGGGPTFFLQVGHTWGTTKTDATDLAVTHSTSYRKNGQTDFVDHNDDEIWFIINPVIQVAALPESVYGPARFNWELDTSGAVPFYLTVGELTKRHPMDPGLKAALEQWGITEEEYPELLKADPFVNGEPATMDPARFDFVGSFPYRPVPAPGYQPSPQTQTVSRKLANASTAKGESSYYVGFREGAEFVFLKLYFWVDEKLTVTSSTSFKTSTETNGSTTITVGQPAYGYPGPQVVRVYEDKVWKTYVFRLEWY